MMRLKTNNENGVKNTGDKTLNEIEEENGGGELTAELERLLGYKLPRTLGELTLNEVNKISGCLCRLVEKGM